jgi:hypothetical protein
VVFDSINETGMAIKIPLSMPVEENDTDRSNWVDMTIATTQEVMPYVQQAKA